MTRHFRSLVGLGALLALALLVSGCAGGQAPAPTPDPFAGLADRSDQAFRQGLEAYGQGQYRDALTAFEQAKTLSPTGDQRIDQMIDRTRAAMAPSPTPVPPTPTDVPATPTATPVALSQQAPDTDLGQRYFGKTTLAMVPGKDSDAPAATQFFFQDQVGLHIEGLSQHLRLPFTLRVFNTDTGTLVASVNSEDASPTPAGLATPSAAPASVSVAPPLSTSDLAGSATANPTQTTTSSQDFKVVHFWDTYVWYHQGGEEPGRYRAELYASGVLTNTFDYTVGTVPVPTPQAQPAEPALPSATDAPAVDDVPPPPPPAPLVPPPTPRPAAPVAAPVPPTATPQPTAIPSPTPSPTPATADTTTSLGGVPAGMDTDSASGRSYVVDATGVIWTTDRVTGTEQPSLSTPWFINANPVDLTVDQSTGYLYVPATNCAQRDQPLMRYCVIALDGRHGGAPLGPPLPLDGPPVQVRVDSSLGLLFVAIPSNREIAELDIRSGKKVRSIVDGARTSPPSPITSLALDPYRQALYAGHLDGEVSVMDETSGRVLAVPTVSNAGLTAVATARGLVYGVNTVTHELAVLEPVSGTVNRFHLSQEPAAVTAAEDTGAVYILSSRNDVILQVDPTDGTELGRVLMKSRSAHLDVDASTKNVQTLRPRIALQDGTDTLLATIPEQGTLAAVGNQQFPLLARDIPFIGAPVQPLVASFDPAIASTDADEEGI
jgi:WD40 repeat protein